MDRIDLDEVERIEHAGLRGNCATSIRMILKFKPFTPSQS